MDNILKNIPNERLSYELYKQGKIKASLEKEVLVHEHKRLIVLAKETEARMLDGLALNKAEMQARTSKEYLAFILNYGDVKEDSVLARAKYSAIEYEIKLRINKSFQDRTDFKSGEITT